MALRALRLSRPELHVWGRKLRPREFTTAHRAARLPSRNSRPGLAASRARGLSVGRTGPSPAVRPKPGGRARKACSPGFLTPRRDPEEPPEHARLAKLGAGSSPARAPPWMPGAGVGRRAVWSGFGVSVLPLRHRRRSLPALGIFLEPRGRAEAAGGPRPPARQLTTCLLPPQRRPRLARVKMRYTGCFTRDLSPSVLAALQRACRGRAPWSQSHSPVAVLPARAGGGPRASPLTARSLGFPLGRTDTSRLAPRDGLEGRHRAGTRRAPRSAALAVVAVVIRARVNQRGREATRHPPHGHGRFASPAFSRAGFDASQSAMHT